MSTVKVRKGVFCLTDKYKTRRNGIQGEKINTCIFVVKDCGSAALSVSDVADTIELGGYPSLHQKKIT